MKCIQPSKKMKFDVSIILGFFKKKKKNSSEWCVFILLPQDNTKKDDNALPQNCNY